MPDYSTVNRTKDHFQDQLLRDHPEIVSISPQLRLDENGQLTEVAYIVIGVNLPHPLRLGPGVTASEGAPSIPSTLPTVDSDGKIVEGTRVDVEIEDEGEITPQGNTTKERPCPGGYSVGHPSICAGTLGGVARVGTEWGYILSNNHVFAATNSRTAGDAIWQPAMCDGGTTNDKIGELTRWVPIDFSGPDNEVDCALAKALSPWANYLSRTVKDIGVPSAVTDAVVGQSIRKSGKKTGLTTGTISSINSTIRPDYGSGRRPRFVNQLKYSHMTQDGDSGSFVWDGSTLSVVGLHLGSSDSDSYGNKMNRVLALLSAETLVYDAQGVPTVFEATDLDIVD